MIPLKVLLSTLVLVSLSFVEAHYHKYSRQEYAVMACERVIESTTTFCLEGEEIEEDPQECFCTSIAEMGSLLICFHEMGYYDNAMVKYLAAECSSAYPDTTLDVEFFDGVYQNATQFAITPEKTLNATLLSYTPIYVSSQDVATYYDANYNLLFNITLSLYLGTGFFGIFVACMIISGIGNWSLILFPGLVSKMNGPMSKRFRALVSLPATFRKDKNVPLTFWGVPVGYIPTRSESIVISFLWIYSALASSVGITAVENNPIWRNRSTEITRYVGDRSGMLAIFIYPLVILLAGRNNFLIYLTRWSFARFNTYHRHMSRMFFFYTIVHTIAMTIHTFVRFEKSVYANWMATPFIAWGIVSTVAMGIMLGQGILFLRRNSYEAFLIAHITLAVFVLVGCHLHIVPFEYEGFTWSVTAVWVADRVVRYIRMARYGLKEATVTLKAGETLKVTVPKPTSWNCGPGQYAFVSFMMPSCFWQSHPFTVISESDTELSFAIKIKGGITHGLYKLLAPLPGQTTTIKVAIDGPYGFSSPAHKYNQSLLMASGHGIPGLYDHAMRLANTKHSVKLIWIIRDYNSISWMLEEMQKLRGTKVETVIYVTRPNEVLDSPLGSSDSRVSFSDKDEKTNLSFEPEMMDAKSIKENLSHISFKEGRPDIVVMLEEEITSAHGTLAVVACGHDSMVDSVRYGVTKNLTCSNHRVDYFEELQTWA